MFDITGAQRAGVPSWGINGLFIKQRILFNGYPCSSMCDLGDFRNTGNITIN